MAVARIEHDVAGRDAERIDDPISDVLLKVIRNTSDFTNRNDVHGNDD